MSIKRDAIYNLFGRLIPLALSIVTIRLYLDAIGEVRYGVLALSWLLLGYFGLFDLGLSRATAQRIAANRKGTRGDESTTFWTAVALNSVFGVVGGLIIWPVAHLTIVDSLDLEAPLGPEAMGALPWLVLAVPVATVTGVLTGALQGKERFFGLNIATTVGTILLQIIPLVIAHFWSPDLRVVLPAAVLSRMLTLLMLFGLCRNAVFGGERIVISKPEARALIAFGGWVTVTAFIGPLIAMADRFVIGFTSGPKAVSYYSVPYQLAQRTTILSGSLTAALFPRFAAASARDDARLTTESLRILIVVVTPAIAVAILLLEPFFSIWISSDFAKEAVPSGQIILIGFWLNSLTRVPFVQLQARGRPDLVARIHFAIALPYVGLLYLGATNIGLQGVAVAFALRSAADLIFVSAFAGSLGLVLSLIKTPLAFVLSALMIARSLAVGDQIWILVVALHSLVSLSWAWRRSPPTLRTVLLRRPPTLERQIHRNLDP